jgi:hypothetical protein
MFQEVEEKTLGQVLSIFGKVSATPSEHVERVPIIPAQLGQSGLPPLRLVLRRLDDDRPARGVKVRRAICWRTVGASHGELRVSSTLAEEITFRNKKS